MKKILILGSTGQVGQELLTRALQSPEVELVTAPTRRALPRHPRLENPIVDFAQLPLDVPWWRADVALSALGTTLRQAKSRERFYQVDHDAVMAAAALCRKAGTPVFGLVSSLGADANSRFFYLKVKGQTEQDLVSLKFTSLLLIRPSLLIGGPRSRTRPLESLGLFIGKHLSFVLPRRYRAVTTGAVAQTLFEASLVAQPGSHIIESESIQD